MSRLQASEAVLRAGSVEFPRDDFLRLMCQSLRGFGFAKAALALEEESGVKAVPDSVTEIRSACMVGNWAAVLSKLPHVPLREEVAPHLPRRLVLEQQFMEALAAGDLHTALTVLRESIAPMAPLSKEHAQRVKELSSLVFCRSESELATFAKWEGQEVGRTALCAKLEALFSPEVVVATTRLQELVGRGLGGGGSRVGAVAGAGAGAGSALQPSLLTDSARHSGGAARIPQRRVAVLHGHPDEVWCLAFSPDGSRLATGSKDGAVRLWRLTATGAIADGGLECDGHPVTHLGWSHDGSMLLVAPQCTLIHTYRVNEEGCPCSLLDDHKDVVTSARWLPGTQRVLSTSADRTIKLWDNDGQVLTSKPCATIITDLQVAHSGAFALALGSDYIVRHVELASLEMRVCIADLGRVMCMSPLSRNDREVLLNLAQDDILLCDVMTGSVLRSFVGPRQSHYVIRSALSPPDDALVASGSEDSRVYVWRREEPDAPAAVLSGHSGTVNAVAWRPLPADASPYSGAILASASDDTTVVLWR
mmetsp:Transcript_16701/g.53344  ORF Transcript_16701/g.53344 Transcript_16701/m.53344 type:complete len:535 (-) Transcript_16701:49-1653(-)